MTVILWNCTPARLTANTASDGPAGYLAIDVPPWTKMHVVLSDRKQWSALLDVIRAGMICEVNGDEAVVRDFRPDARVSFPALN